ncbi:hypothetical protein [Legionella gresilensis]|uniref:hypothetical protein n=1 Tax=Legionella gresilensis TaxID=91823 RepID=UPI0010417FCA|nr:hypothetical protein [Legionella gresilensis]
MSSNFKNFISPEKRAKRLRDNSGSYNKLDGTLKSTDLVKNYKKERLVGVAGFKDLDGKPMSDKLSASDPITQQFTQELENALKLTDDTDKALKEFETQVAEFNSKAHNSAEVASKIQAFRTTLVQEIEKQQRQEKDNLISLLDGNNFPAVAGKMGVGADRIDQLKDQMKIDLAAAQEKELKKIKGALEDQALRLMNAIAAEEARITALASFYDSPDAKRMRANIDRLAEKNANTNRAVISMDGNTGRTKFKGINFKDIEDLQTVTGLDVKHADDGGFSMEFPRFRFNSTAALYDLTSIAQMVRASGAEKITMKVTHDDPEKAMELGRKAYEGALLAGFDPNTDKEKNIAIEVNGKIVKVDELFAKHPHRRKLIEEKAADMKKQTESFSPALQEQQKLKKDLQATKKASQDKSTKQPQPSNSPALSR